MDGRDEKSTAKYVIQGVCILGIVILVAIDSQNNVDVPQLAYWIIGGIALGIQDIRALLGGGNDKRN